MSEAPTVTRLPGGKLQLSDSAERLVRALATDHGENPDDTVAEVRRDLPLARLVLRMIGLDVPRVQNGRPRERSRDWSIFVTTCRLVDEFGYTEGVERAQGELKLQGITNRNGRALSLSRIRAVYKDRDGQRIEDRLQEFLGPSRDPAD